MKSLEQLHLVQNVKSFAMKIKSKQIFSIENHFAGGREATWKGFCNNRNDPCQSQQGEILYFSQHKLGELLCMLPKTDQTKIFPDRKAAKQTKVRHRENF